MKRAPATTYAEDDYTYIPGITDDVVLHEIISYTIPRELGALSCVSKAWRDAIPAGASVCYANALAPDARGHPAVFGTGDYGTMATIILNKLARRNFGVGVSACELDNPLSPIRQHLDFYVKNHSGTCETLQEEYGSYNNGEAAYTCASCADPIIASRFRGITDILQCPLGGRNVHRLDLAFHEKCGTRKDIARYLTDQILALFRRICIDRFRIHRPRGMCMDQSSFEALVNRTHPLHVLAGTLVGNDHREQLALWDVFTEYPPHTPEPTS